MSSAAIRRIIVAAFACMMLAAAPGALAGDAYWHGKRGPIWDHGPDRSRDLSNWYTKSPSRGGKMTRPPDDLALFAQGAKQRDIWIVKQPDDASDITTPIGLILILRDAPRYEFFIRFLARLKLKGQGLLTQSDNTPRFVLESASVMLLTNSARLNSPTDRTSAVIEVGRGAHLQFDTLSRGGNAKVSNSGNVRFDDRSSAETMSFTLPGGFSNPAPIIQFFGRSNPDRATFRLGASSILNFGATSGPDGSERITSGTITNSGNVFTGTNVVTVDGRYEQPDRSGSLTVQARGSRVGHVFVRGKAKLAGGALYVTLPKPGQTLLKGVYRIVYARDGVEGRFETLGPSFSNWRLEYLPNEVRLIVD